MTEKKTANPFIKREGDFLLDAMKRNFLAAAREGVPVSVSAPAGTNLDVFRGQIREFLTAEKCTSEEIEHVLSQIK